MSHKRPLVNEGQLEEKSREETSSKPQLSTPRPAILQTRTDRSGGNTSGDFVQKGLEGFKAVLQSLGLDSSLASKLEEKYFAIDEEIRKINEKIDSLERERNKLLADKEKLTRLLKMFSEIRS
jgi:hypothetical protein